MNETEKSSQLKEDLKLQRWERLKSWVPFGSLFKRMIRRLVRELYEKELEWQKGDLKSKFKKRNRKEIKQVKAEYQDLLSENRKRINRLQREFRKIPVHRYGSFTPGRKDWESRWDRSSGSRVLLYALSDYSGSFFKWAEAINHYTNFAARLVTFEIHQFGYETDLVLPYPEVLNSSDIGQLAKEADIIHIKDETGFFTGSNQLPQDLLSRWGKPQIYTAYGGYTRKWALDNKFRDYVKSFETRIAMTPDLNFDWFDGYFIPHAIDCDRYPYSWVDGICLAHSPSNQVRKGTKDLQAAIRGLDLNFDLIHDVSHQECIERKSKSNLFFDQAGQEVQARLGVNTVIGWYGNSALEAAVFGIPTIAHLSDEAFEGAIRAGRDIREECAIINTPLGAEGIRKTIKEFFGLSKEDRQEISRRTRSWVERFHSYQVCAHELEQVYTEVLEGPRS